MDLLIIQNVFSTVPGKAAVPPPTSRSGHRMVLLKRHLVLFGGFHDNLDKCTYFNDVHVFSLEERYMIFYDFFHLLITHFGVFKYTKTKEKKMFLRISTLVFKKRSIQKK